ncbi:MAG: LexA family protein [Bacteroidales bacterium]
MKIIHPPKLSAELESIPLDSEAARRYAKYYEGGVQAGFPSPADDFKDTPLSLDERYLSNPNQTFLIRVVGDSMYPTLMLGDILIVKSDREIEDGEIGIISVNHTDFTVKRLSKKESRLVADNPAHDNISLGDDDTVVCLGVVRHLVRDVDK